MKKPLRLFLFVVGGGGLALAVLLVLAFTPAVQTWAVRRAVAGLPGVKIEVGRVAIGLNSVHVENLRITQPGMLLALPSADLEVPILAAARGQVHIGKITAKDWTLDLTPTTPDSVAPTAVAGPAALFAGVFHFLQLPVDLSIESVDLEGDVTQPASHAHVVLTGGGLGAGRDASFALGSTLLATGVTTSSVNTVALRGTVGAHMDTARTFSNLALTADITAGGPKLAQNVPGHLNIGATRDAQGEHYQLTITKGGTGQDSTPLAHFELAVPASLQTPLTGLGSIHATDAEVTPFALGRKLPVFKADGQWSFSVSRDFKEFDANGKLDGAADNLATLWPGLAALGRQDFALDFAAQHQGNVTKVSRLKFRVGGDRPIVSVEALQGFNYDAEGHKLEAANAAADLMQVDLADLPLEVVQPVLPPGMEVKGGTIAAQLQASARDGGVIVRSAAPLVLGHVAMTKDGQPMINDATLTCTIAATDTPAGWKVALADGSVQSKDANLFTFSTQAGQVLDKGEPIKGEGIKATGNFVVDFPSLAGQPAAGALRSLSHGTATIGYTAVLGDQSGLELKLDTRNMTAADQTKLADLTVDARADIATDGGLNLNVPFIVTQDGRISSVTLGGTVGPAKSGVRTVDLQLKGDVLYVADVLPLFPGGDSQAAPNPPAVGSSLPSTAAATPGPSGAPWAGLAGTLKYEIKKVVFSPAWEASLRGSAKVDPGAVALDVSGILGADAPFTATARMTYTAASVPPYALKADVKLTNFNTAPLLTTIEGRADFAAQLTSAAATPAGLGDGVQGKVMLTSKGGVCRLLAVADGSSLVQTATAVGASVLGNVVGVFAGTKAGANTTSAVNKIAGLLREIRYDQLNLTVSRDAKENIVLDDFNLIAPEVRLAGQGQVQHVPGNPVLEQPLKLQLAVAARGSLGNLMSSVGLVKASPDDLGYLPLVLELPELGGTLQKPDTNAFYKKLAERAGTAAAERVTNGVTKGAGALLDGLLGK